MKIIASTNICESGVTLTHIHYVIDSLLCRDRFYNSHLNTNELKKVFISKRAADQRASRAGRLGNGVCYRMSTKSDFEEKLIKNHVSDFLKTDLSFFYFYCKSIGIKNICEIDLLTVYDRQRIEHAVEFLYSMKLVDDQGDMTPLGSVVSVVPLEMKLAVALVMSFEESFACAEEVLIIGFLNSYLNVISYSLVYLKLASFFVYFSETNYVTILSSLQIINMMSL